MKRTSLVKARKAGGYTQRELALKINKSFSSVQKYELGIVNPDYDTVFQIAYACKIDPSELLTAYAEELAEEAEYNPPSNYMEQQSLENEIAVLWSRIQKAQKICKSENSVSFLEVEESIKENMMSALAELNKEGQQKAVERVRELAEVPRYQRHSEAHTAAEVLPEGKAPDQE